MEPIVYVVPIIDTEGPTTGRSDLFDNWNSLGEAMKKFTVETRSGFRDSFGGAAVFSWFILDWSGFSSGDPEFRRRGYDNRLHAVWNFYREHILTDARLKESGDGIYWHYHHPPKDGSWGWNAYWNDSLWHEYIIARRMFDFRHFPAAYRAGKYVENNENSQWLERWIPFDFSSIAPAKREFCDWSKAPVSWQPYHPGVGDYMLPGGMKRWVARSLPVAAKGGSGELTGEEAELAFREAKDSGKAIFSFHSHDFYRSVFDDMVTAIRMVEDASRKSGVTWKFSNALEAMRSYAGSIRGDLSFNVDKRGMELHISSSHEIFGDMPFVAIEYANGDLRRVDVNGEHGVWSAKIPDAAVRVAVGGSDDYGNTAVSAMKI